MRLLAGLLMAVSLLAATNVRAAETPRKVYVCPMASHPKEYDKPGSCPLCGMTLVEKDARFRVAVVVFPFAEDIDFTAPVEVLGQSGAQVFTVAATADPVDTVFGLHIRPDYDLAHAPAADLIVVPGGGVNNALKDDRIVSWIRERAPKARYVMSVCNGAFILAKAGLLDGLRATTTSGRIDQLATEYPAIHVVRERVVDNGKIITAAGLSAGIDGALHVIDREFGRLAAERVARGIEYRWEPDSKWTRSALADTRLPDLSLPPDASWEPATSQGDTREWHMSGRLHVAMSSDAFLEDAARQIAGKGWTLRESADGRRTFVKKDREGQTWLATLESRPDPAGGALDEAFTIRAVDSAER